MCGKRSSAWLNGWQAAERGRFAPWLPVFMGTGVLCYFALRTEPPLWLGLAVAIPATCGVAAAEAPRCIARRRHGAGRSGHRLHRRHSSPPPARRPSQCCRRHATILTGTRPFRGAAPRGTAHRTGSGATGRRRAAAALASGAAEEGRRAGGRHRRHGPGARAGPAADAARLSWRLGPAARCLVQRPRRFRLRAGSGRAHRRNAAETVRCAWCSACARSIAQHISAVVPGAAGAVSITLLTGDHHRHPAARP